MLSAQKKTGGQILVDTLVAHGIRRAFCVPGESYLAVLDALYDSPIELITCRQEGGAAMMAEAQGKLTDKPGICFVTRGPGATNASAGVHVAKQDSTPMILFIGQVERSFRGREAWQEIDYTKFCAPICKWVTEVEDAAQLPDIVTRAFHVAVSGRPGPVVISLPEDMLMDKIVPPAVSFMAEEQPMPDPAKFQEAGALLAKAKAPVLILGGSTWDEEGRAAITRFAETWNLPVVVTFRRQHLFDHTHQNFAGHAGYGIDAALGERIKNADVVMLVGGRFSEVPSQSYTLMDAPQPRQMLIHIHPDTLELGRVYNPKLGICARADTAAKHLAALEAPKNIPWADATRSARAIYEKWCTPTQNAGPVQVAELVMTMAERVPEDAIICNAAGNYAAWIHRFYPFRHFKTQLAPNSGSMGYGLPAAISAKAQHRDRVVICYTGDGDLMMSVQELATAALHGLNIIVIVIDNGMYGTIRLHQEKNYPGRVVGTDLKNPDFATLAKSFGYEAFTVHETQDFAPAFDGALKSKTPSLIHVLIDPEAITPSTTLSAVRAAAQRA